MMRLSNFMILVLYVDNVLFTSNNMNMLTKMKLMLLKYFEMKDLTNASFVLSTEIHYNRSQGELGLSQQSYIEKILKRFNLSTCFHVSLPI